MGNKNINELLLESIEMHNVKSIVQLLENGADPNYTIHEDDDKELSKGLMQPTTPLRMVMFRISDCMLDVSQITLYGEIASILIRYGTDPKPAMKIAEHRYSNYDPNAEKNPFMKVWDIIARAQ